MLTVTHQLLLQLFEHFWSCPVRRVVRGHVFRRTFHIVTSLGLELSGAALTLIPTVNFVEFILEPFDIVLLCQKDTSMQGAKTAVLHEVPIA
jgi:hypothetical protein